MYVYMILHLITNGRTELCYEYGVPHIQLPKNHLPEINAYTTRYKNARQVGDPTCRALQRSKTTPANHTPWQMMRIHARQSDPSCFGAYLLRPGRVSSAKE